MISQIINQIDPDYERRFLLACFELKVKLAAKNRSVMATELENYIKNYAETTAENFGRDLKSNSSPRDKEEPITGETIRKIIREVKEKKDNATFLISSDRTELFLKSFNIIANKSIKEKKDYSLSNILKLDFYKYPGDDVLEKYIYDNKLNDTFTADSLFEYIITKHDEISKKLCEKFKPRLVLKELITTGKILKKNEWYKEYSENLLEQQSIVNDPDFDEVFLPKDVSEIFICIDENIIKFISEHIRFFRLISKNKNLADILKIKESSLIQYETTHKKTLDDSMLCKLVEHFTKEQDKNIRQLFDYFFTEITCPAFSTDSKLRNNFSELIKDYTFLRYTKYQRDNSTKRKDADNIRQKTIDLLEIEIKYFVFKTINKSFNLKNTFLPELQELFDK